MEWSIQQLARHAGVTSRTLRHYDAVGLLPPSRIGANGYRYYDGASIARLQRILLLRQLGVGIPAILDSLADGSDADALDHHLRWLHLERDRIQQQIRAVERTVRVLRDGGEMDVATAFEGFDQAQYEREVTQRWGADAWRAGQEWWTGLAPDEREAFQQQHRALASEYADARDRALEPGDDVVQQIVERHVRWVARSWRRTPTAAEILGLGEMYAADPRFAEQYGGAEGAAYVRDAMRVFAGG